MKTLFVLCLHVRSRSQERRCGAGDTRGELQAHAGPLDRMYAVSLSQQHPGHIKTLKDWMRDECFVESINEAQEHLLADAMVGKFCGVDSYKR